MVKAAVFDIVICWFESSYLWSIMMNSFFLCFIEISLGVYVSVSILFSVILSGLSYYSYPRLLSALSTFSIFIFISLLLLILNFDSLSLQCTKGVGWHACAP